MVHLAVRLFIIPKMPALLLPEGLSPFPQPGKRHAAINGIKNHGRIKSSVQEKPGSRQIDDYPEEPVLIYLAGEHPCCNYRKRCNKRIKTRYGRIGETSEHEKHGDV